MTNVVVLQGRLARDPELRQTNTGKQVARFTLAVDRGRKDANGQSQTDWINVIAWERLADFAYKYLSKGQMVNVDGRLRQQGGQRRPGLPCPGGPACRCTGLQPGAGRGLRTDRG